MPSFLEFPKRVAVQAMDDEVPELAAGLAYRFLFAIFPFGIFLAALAAFVAQSAGLGDPTDEIVAALGDNLPREVAAQVAPQLEVVLVEAQPGLMSIGALAALWAATGGISSLMGAMNKAYDVKETRHFLVKTALAVALTAVGSLGILVAFVTIVGGSVLTEQAIETLGLPRATWDVIALLRWPLVLVLVAVAVASLFRFGPNVAVSYRWTLVGGAAFAVGWLVATAAFSLYVANFGSYANTYGALGGVIVLMLWFYLTALLLLLAAELTSVLAKDREPELVQARRDETAHAVETSGAPGRQDPEIEVGEPAPRPTSGRDPWPRRTADALAPTGATAAAAAAAGAAASSTSSPSSTGQRAASRLFAFVVLVVGGAAGVVAGILARGNDERTSDA